MSIRTLTFSTLYPSSTIPYHGVFVEQRLRNLLQSAQVESMVVAPVPWFPFASSRFGKYARYALIPPAEVLHGIRVLHPRYPLIPKIGMVVSPILMASALVRLVSRLNADQPGFDLIDAHYFYPDGIAAVILGRLLRKPVMITARGTDVNLIPDYRLPRVWIRWAADNCAGIITVSEALRSRMLELGVDAEKVRTLRNGVDLDVFRPVPDRMGLRQRLDIKGKVLLSVGHLIERKGHHIVIEALVDLPNVQLLIVGDGELRGQLQSLAIRLGVADRISFTGAVSQDRLMEYYNAADALVLASSREGMANVLLESIACGTPVIGTPYWGTPEVIAERRAGVLMKDRSARAVVDAYNDLITDMPPRSEVRDYATRFSWQETTNGQLDVFRSALDSSRG